MPYTKPAIQAEACGEQAEASIKIEEGSSLTPPVRRRNLQVNAVCRHCTN